LKEADPLPKLDDYSEVVGQVAIDHLVELSNRLSSSSILHINSTSVGGGVAEILNRMVPLFRELGIDARWDVIKGGEEFFDITKKFHNALQGEKIELDEDMFKTYQGYNAMNADAVSFDKDVVFVHDPQPAALIDSKEAAKSSWVWRCHIDISSPLKGMWGFLKRFVERYDASIFSMASFSRPDLKIPQFMIHPSIDPLSEKNIELTESEVEEVMERFEIDRKKAIITQIGRFDRFKDPLGVIEAYRIVKKRIDCQLVLAGGMATDDPEGGKVFQEVKKKAEGDPDIHLIELPPFSDLEVNAFQRVSSVVVQKSVKEGFGLTVAEAMWKSKPVVGGAVGGIPSQIINGINGYLIHSTEGAANRIAYLLRNSEEAEKMGKNGREYVKDRFLLTRHLRDYLLVMHCLEHPGERFIQL